MLGSPETGKNGRIQFIDIVRPEPAQGNASGVPGS